MKKVAIVGGAPRSKNLAPYDDEEWEIWAMGVHLSDHKRISRIFEIHPDLFFSDDKYPEDLVNYGVPLIVDENFPVKADNVIHFPMDDAMNIMGGMLTSTAAFMMAYAILEGVTHISIYGIDMDVDDNEYFYQRPGMYAWIAYAKSQGIIIDIPESSLFKDEIYSRAPNKNYLPYTNSEFVKMANLHQDKINEYNDQIAKLTRLIDTHAGCKQVYERMAKIARATDAGIKVESINHSTVIRS